MLVVIGVGLFLLSAPWFAFMLGITWVGWGVVAMTAAPSAGWTHFGFGLLSASALSVLVFITRVRTFRRLESLRIQDEQQKKELEEAAAEARQNNDTATLWTMPEM
jgi:hypothetical protein